MQVLSRTLAVASLIWAACITSLSNGPDMKKLTPILTVDAIEPGLGFWVDRLGFTVTAEVPAGDRLGFVMLDKEGLELMLQTRASVEADDARLAAELSGGATCLYLEVADLDSILERLGGVPVVVPKRTTFYGATEVFVREPGGHIVGFAEMQKSEK